MSCLHSFKKKKLLNKRLEIGGLSLSLGSTRNLIPFGVHLSMFMCFNHTINILLQVSFKYKYKYKYIFLYIFIYLKILVIYTYMLKKHTTYNSLSFGIWNLGIGINY